MTRRSITLALAASLVAAVAAAAPAAADDPAFVAAGLGWYDFNDDQGAGSAQIEYRSELRLGPFKPFAGVMATSDAAGYLYGGILVDLYFGRRMVFTPNVAAGYYLDGDGKDLGSAIEFRSGLELAWRFDDRSRLGLAVHHISNASIGERNPGTEILSVIYALPLN